MIGRALLADAGFERKAILFVAIVGLHVLGAVATVIGVALVAE